MKISLDGNARTIEHLETCMLMFAEKTEFKKKYSNYFMNDMQEIFNYVDVC